MREIFLRKYKQSFSLAHTMYVHQLQYSAEFKYLTSESGHKTNKIRECAGENSSSRGSVSPEPGARLPEGVERLREDGRSMRPADPGAARASCGTPVNQERVREEHSRSVSIYKCI